MWIKLGTKKALHNSRKQFPNFSIIAVLILLRRKLAQRVKSYDAPEPESSPLFSYAGDCPMQGLAHAVREL